MVGMGTESTPAWDSALGAFLWSAAAAAGSVAVMAMLVLVRRAVRRRLLLSRDQRRREYREFFTRLLAERRPDQPLPRLPKRILDPAFLDALGEVMERSAVNRVHVTVMCEITGCVETLCRATRSLAPHIRGRAARWLGRIGSRLAIPDVVRLLDDSSPRVRTAAIDALGSLASFRDDQSLQGLLRLLDRLGQGRAGAEGSLRPDLPFPALTSALAAHGSEAVPALIARLRSGQDVVRAIAADALANIPERPAHATDALLDALRDVDPEVRARAARAVARTGSADPLIPVIHALGDRVWFVRLQAARALGSLGYPRAAGALVTALLDESWQVRAAAADALRRLGPSAMMTLADTLLASRDRYAKEQIVEELQRTPMLRQQIDALEDEADTGLAAHRFLVEVARHGVTTVLIDELRGHASTAVRRRLVSVLGECDAPRVQAALHDVAANDPVGEVQDAACRVLVRARRRTGPPGRAA